MNWLDFYAERNFRTPFGAKGTFYSAIGHRGLDLRTGPREMIPSYVTGRVVQIFRSVGLGLVVVVQQDDGRYVAWAHLYGVAVALGQGVVPGTPIARAATYGDMPGTLWAGSHTHTTYGTHIGIGSGVYPGILDPAPRIRAAVAAGQNSGGGSSTTPPSTTPAPGAPTEEEELMGALDDIRKMFEDVNKYADERERRLGALVDLRIAQMEARNARENRARLYRNNVTGAIIAVKIESGFLWQVPTPAYVDLIASDMVGLVGTQEPQHIKSVDENIFNFINQLTTHARVQQALDNLRVFKDYEPFALAMEEAKRIRDENLKKLDASAAVLTKDLGELTQVYETTVAAQQAEIEGVKFVGEGAQAV